jgi:hypothetical protein
MDKQQLNALWNTLSPRRLAKYFEAAGENRERAIRLYLWNAQVGAAFHLPIQTCEVALRNRIEAVLGTMFGGQWFAADEFLALASEDRHKDLTEARSRIRRFRRPSSRSKPISRKLSRPGLPKTIPISRFRSASFAV